MSTRWTETPAVIFSPPLFSPTAPPTPEIDKRNAAYLRGDAAILTNFIEWLVREEILYLDDPAEGRGLMLDFLGIDESKISEELLLLHEFRQNIEMRRVK